MKYHIGSRYQQGFTIVELMIATAILSLILLLTTMVISNIGSLYFKGVNQSRIQDDVRFITDDVAQHLELTDQLLSTGSQNYGITVNAYCIGNTRYSYVLNTQLGTSAGHVAHVLWRDTNTSGSCTPLNLTQSTPPTSMNGSELIAPNSRLTDFTILGPSPYSISLAAAYGDDDLLNLSGLNTTCKGTTGEQFCATASLQTVAVQRITGSP